MLRVTYANTPELSVATVLVPETTTHQSCYRKYNLFEVFL